jgi:hypothetical protein
VTESAREREVQLDPADHMDEVVCPVLIYPLDVIALPRSAKPTRFSRASGADTSVALPPKADWWIPLSVSAALDTGRTEREQLQHRLSFSVLPRDATRSAEDYQRLAQAAYVTRDEVTQRKLLHNPGANRNKVVMGWITAYGHYEVIAADRLRFFLRYGRELASDPRTSRPWLEMLMQMVYSADTARVHTPPYHEVALDLSRNAAVMGDSLMARWLTFATYQDAEANAAACRAFLSRYSRRWAIARDSTGAATAYTGPNCR